MTKVWPDFTKAQPRGRLKRAASVTRVVWRLAEKLRGRGSETRPGALREERQSAYEASHVRLFVNVILLRVFRVCAITSCLILWTVIFAEESFRNMLSSPTVALCNYTFCAFRYLVSPLAFAFNLFVLQ